MNIITEKSTFMAHQIIEVLENFRPSMHYVSHGVIRTDNDGNFKLVEKFSRPKI